MKPSADASPRIAFFSTMAGSPWGGSEELWAQAAVDLAARGTSVSASVRQWTPQHPRIHDLLDSGVRIIARQPHFSLPERVWRNATRQGESYLTAHLRKFLESASPSLLVLSDGFILPPVELMELCVRRRQSFVTVSHANHDTWWADDREAERYRGVITSARCCYFVSKGNLALLEKQIAFQLPNAEIIWSPVNVAYGASPAFPAYAECDVLRLAAVGRLHPPSKGQDLLIEALAAPRWRHRKWHLNLYGGGNMKGGLQALVQRCELSERVSFAGFAKPEDIWARNHALVMPSRYEGLPLAIIEAMLCGRAVAATDVGGNAEVIDDDVTGFVRGGPTVADIADLLERLWAARSQLEDIGKRAAKYIRQLAPAEPAKLFADALRRMAIA